jgi:hypothetical protein
MWMLRLRNWYWIQTKSSFALYERAIATDGSKHYMTTDLANELIAAGSRKLAARNKNLKRWCNENGQDVSAWEKIGSEDEATSLMVTQIALRFAARTESRK